MITKLLILGIIENSLDYLNFILNLENTYNIFNNLLDIKIILFNVSNISFANILQFEINNINYQDLDLKINECLITNQKYQFCYFVNPNTFIFENDLTNIFSEIINYNLITFKTEYKIYPQIIKDINLIDRNKAVPLFIKNHSIFRSFFFKIDTILIIGYLNNITNPLFLEELILKLNDTNYNTKLENNTSILFNLRILKKKFPKSEFITFSKNNGIIIMNDFGTWGLGNQLFQYSFMYIIQLKLSKKIHFLKKKVRQMSYLA